MKKNEPVEVSIETLDQDGCGYSSDLKQAVFGSLPGERVLATPVSRRRGRLYLRATEIYESSVDRVEPACGAALYCGGCSYQHLSHEAQLQHKVEFLRQQLYPLVPENWLTPLTGSPYQYRSKARLGVKHVYKKERVLVGFREKMKPYIADTAHCPVLVEPVDALIGPLAELIAGLSEPDTVPQIELSSGDSDVALIFRHLNPLTPDDVERLRQFGEHHDLQIYLQPGGVDSTHRIFPEGDSPILLTYELPDFDLKFEFSPQDFTQVNLPINRQMVRLAMDLLEPNKDDRVFDAFCGIGNFSLSAAREAGSVLGAENAQASVERARLNASQNGIKNAQFEVRDLHEKSIDIKEIGNFNKVLLDPPRSGAEALVKELASTDVERLVYVSCNPQTLSRDIKLLVQNGFKLHSAGIIDMFPHTTHVESIALLVSESVS